MRTWERASARACATALLALVAVTGCKKGKAAEESAQPEVATVEKRDLNVTAEASGLIEPIKTVEIKSKASGEVTAVHAETGDNVQRGTLLVEVDPRDVRNAMEQAQADLEVANARVQTSGANFSRVKELRKTNVSTEQELETAVLDNANAKAALVKAQTNLELAKQRMNDVTIRAPLDGTVIERTVEPGTIIASASGTFGGGTTLLKMADLAQVQVRAQVDETDIGKIEPGQSATVTVEAYPGRRFTGQVMKIEPQAVVDQNVTMFPVLIYLQNQEGLLKPGMNTEVEIQIAHKTDAIVVPNDAVVAMRDANTAGAALGLSEDQMKTALEKARENMGGQFGGAAAGAGADAGAAGSAAGASARTGAQRPTQRDSAAAKPSGAAPQLSAECTALREKARSGGFESMSDDDRTKMRACFMAMRQQQGGQAGQNGGWNPGRNGQSGERSGATAQRRSFGGGMGGNGFGGFGGRRRGGNTRPGIVFVSGAKGPEPRMVMLGVNDWDYTEVVNGLKEGEKVLLMTAARLQQQQTDMQNRIRSRENMGGMRNTQQPQGTQSQVGGGGGGGRGPDH